MAVCLALPLALSAGCEKKTASKDSTSVSDGTNAAMVQADNSGKNVRDRNDATLTSGDQGTSPADRATTTRIRQNLVSGPNDYSTTAKNIKIITVNGKVTLRGPVKTEAVGRQREGDAELFADLDHGLHRFRIPRRVPSDVHLAHGMDFER